MKRSEMMKIWSLPQGATKNKKKKQNNAFVRQLAWEKSEDFFSVFPFCWSGFRDFKPKSDVFISRFQTQLLSVKKTQMSKHFNILFRATNSPCLLKILKEFMVYETQDHSKCDSFLSTQTFLEWFFSIPASQVLSVRSSRQKGFIISKKLLLKPISVTAFGILLTWRRKPSFSFQGNLLQRESFRGIRSFKCILFDMKVSSLWEARNIWI